MDAVQQIRTELGSSLTGTGGLAAADRLCSACVEVLNVDGAALSLMYDGATRGTFGSSSELSRRLDEFQFTFGEGPCLEAVRTGLPILVADFDDQRESRWPAFAEAVLEVGVRAVFALPVTLANTPVGALDLFSSAPGPLETLEMAGALWAAELSGIPLLDLMTDTPDGSDFDGWEQLTWLNRVEVHQATGMIIAALDVGPIEGLMLLRAHAIAEGMTASECAWAVIERRMSLNATGLGHRPSPEEGLQ